MRGGNAEPQRRTFWSCSAAALSSFSFRIAASTSLCVALQQIRAPNSELLCMLLGGWKLNGEGRVETRLATCTNLFDRFVLEPGFEAPDSIALSSYCSLCGLYPLLEFVERHTGLPVKTVPRR